MTGARLGHKFIKNVSRIGKKVVKGVAIGAAFGGALLTGASYSIGKKEVAKSEANRDRIRGEAEEALRQREAERDAENNRLRAENVRLQMERAHKDTFTVGDSGLQQQDPLAVRERARDGRLVAAEGPQQDPLDFALSQAEKGAAAASSFEKGKRVGGAVGAVKKAIPNPFKK
jgi:hypothetical protein